MNASAKKAREIFIVAVKMAPEQFHRAYPQAIEFFERKRAYDPEGLFDNQFYRTSGMR